MIANASLGLVGSHTILADVAGLNRAQENFEQYGRVGAMHEAGPAPRRELDLLGGPDPGE